MDRRRAAGALLALAACIACSAAAPYASNQTSLDLYDGPSDGCYYNFQHYGEGDRIMTNEPCLNCTCHNRMLMCYLRVCPFTKPIGQDCTVEKRADQCCPIVTCPDVPVDLLTSTSTSSPAEYGSTGLGKLDKYGCSIYGKYFPEGSKVPPTPNKPCEHCYCIRNMTTCVMQECTLHVDGCTPIYHKDVCCPVRYSCDHPEDEIPLLDDMTTTVRPTPGFLLTTTTLAPVTQMTQDCVHDDQIFPDGALIKTKKACEHCYCMKGDIVCVVQECGTPMENEGKNCTSMPPREGQCCPDTYICEGDEFTTDLTKEPAYDEVTTLSPPRRVSVEGSGYRDVSEESYTELPTFEPEFEGSGEEHKTITPVDTTNVPEKEEPGLGEEIITPTEGLLHIPTASQAPDLEEPGKATTELDEGQNTVPSGIEESSEPFVSVKTTPGKEIDVTESTLTSGGEQTTLPEYHITSSPDSSISREYEYTITTEPTSRRKEDEGFGPIESSTQKDIDRITTISIDTAATPTHTELHTTEAIIPSFEQEAKSTTVQLPEYTYPIEETVKPQESTNESHIEITTSVSVTSSEKEPSITTASEVSEKEPSITTASEVSEKEPSITTVSEVTEKGPPITTASEVSEKEPSIATVSEVTEKEPSITTVSEVTEKEPSITTASEVTEKESSITIVSEVTEKEPSMITVSEVTEKEPSITTVLEVTEKEPSITTLPEVTEKKPSITTVSEVTEKEPSITTLPEVTEKEPSITTVSEVTEKEPSITTVPEGTEKEPSITTVPEVADKEPSITTVSEVTEKEPSITTVPEVAEKEPSITTVSEVTEKEPLITTVPEVTEKEPSITTVSEVTEKEPSMITVSEVTEKEPSITTVLEVTEKEPSITTLPEVTEKKPSITTVSEVTEKEPSITTVPIGTEKEPSITTVSEVTEKEPSITTVPEGTEKEPSITTVPEVADKEPSITTVSEVTEKEPSITTVPEVSEKEPSITTVSEVTEKEPSITTVTEVTEKESSITTVSEVTEKEPSITTVSEVIGEPLFTTSIPDKSDVFETTTLNPLESGRIPGEGDCLIDGRTYRNNSDVTSINKCHSSCRCVSSIVKCDPIICSPPPENTGMSNCQQVYETAQSCCPTYVCDDSRETIPPESHSHVSGTESPITTPKFECVGDECHLDEGKEPKPETSDCGPEGCRETQGPIHVPSIPTTESCTDGKCQTSPTKEEPCNKETGCDLSVSKPCENDNCETEVETVPSKRPQPCDNEKDCTDIKTPEPRPVLCRGDNCETEVGTVSPEVSPEHCKNEEDCKEVKTPKPSTQPCEGEDCKTEIETVPSEDLPQHCENEEDCKEIKTPKPSTAPCEGEDCKTEVGTVPSEGLPQHCENEEDCKEIKTPKPTTATDVGTIPTEGLPQQCENEQDCKEIKTTEPSTAPCEGDDCEVVPLGTIPPLCEDGHDCKEIEIPEPGKIPCEGKKCGIDIETPPKDVPQSCENEGDCKETKTPEPTSCEGDNCRRTDTGPLPSKDLSQLCENENDCKEVKTPGPVICEGSNCRTEIETTSPSSSDECTEENCNRKETFGVESKPTECTEADCLQQPSTPTKDTTDTSYVSTESPISKPIVEEITTPISGESITTQGLSTKLTEPSVTKEQELYTELPEYEGFTTKTPEPEDTTKEQDMLSPELPEVSTKLPELSYTESQDITSAMSQHVPEQPQPEIPSTETQHIPEKTATEQQEIVTDIPEEQFTVTKSQEESTIPSRRQEVVTQQEEKITPTTELYITAKVPVTSLDQDETSTKASDIPIMEPETTETSQTLPQFTESKEVTTKAEQEQEILTEFPPTTVIKEQSTEIPQVTESAVPEAIPEEKVTEQQEKATEAPETEEQPGVTGTDLPEVHEVTKLPEQEERPDIVTKAPEESITETQTKIPELEFSLSTKSPEETEPEHGEISTKTPDKGSAVTELPGDHTSPAKFGEKGTEISVTELEEISTKAPELPQEPITEEQDITTDTLPEQELGTKTPVSDILHEQSTDLPKTITEESETKLPEPHVTLPQEPFTNVPEIPKTTERSVSETFTISEHKTEVPVYQETQRPLMNVPEEDIPQKTTETPLSLITEQETDTKAPVSKEEEVSTKAPGTHETELQEISTELPESYVTVSLESSTKILEPATKKEEPDAEAPISAETKPHEVGTTPPSVQEKVTLSESPVTSKEDLHTTVPEIYITEKEYTGTEPSVTLVTQPTEESMTESHVGEPEQIDRQTEIPGALTTESLEVITKVPETVVSEEETKTELPETLSTEIPQQYITDQEFSTKLPEKIDVQEDEDGIKQSLPPDTEHVTTQGIDMTEALIPGDETRTAQPEMEDEIINTLAPEPSVIVPIEPVTEQYELDSEKSNTTEVEKMPVTEKQETSTKTLLPTETEISEPYIPVHEEKSTTVPPLTVTEAEEIKTEEPEKATKGLESPITEEYESVTKDTEGEIQTETPIQIPIESQETKEPEQEQSTKSPQFVTSVTPKEQEKQTEIPIPSVTETSLEEVTVAEEGIRTEVPASLVTEPQEISTKRPEDNIIDHEDKVTPTSAILVTQKEPITEAPEGFVTKEHEVGTELPELHSTQQTQITGVPEPSITERVEPVTETQEQGTKAPQLYETRPESIPTESSESSVEYATSYTEKQDEMVTKLPEGPIIVQEVKTEIPVQETATEPQPALTGESEASSELPITESELSIDTEVTKAPVESVTQPQEIVTITPEGHITKEEEAGTQIPVTTETELEKLGEEGQKPTVTESYDHITKATEREPLPTESHTEGEVEVTGSFIEGQDVSSKSPEEVLLEEITKLPETPKLTSEPQYEYSETTPYFVELEEHTHKDEVPFTVHEEEPSTAPPDVHITVPTREELEGSMDKHIGDKETERPQEHEEKPIDDHEKISTVSDMYPTTLSLDEELPQKTSKPLVLVTEIQEESKYTTEIPKEDERKEVSASTTISLGEDQPTTSTFVSETEKPVRPDIEVPVKPEKDFISSTEKPVETDLSVITTASEEEYSAASTKATTAKTEEEASTQPPTSYDKFTKPEDKPSEAYTPSASEVPKPPHGVQPVDEVPPSEDETHFPPSGSGYGHEPDYMEEDQAFGPGTCRYGGKVYVSAQQIPRDDPCDFCFCFRSDIICLQQSCPPPIHGCHEEPIQGFCCPRYECPVSMATTLNVTTTTTTTTTTLPPHFLPHAYKGMAHRRGCQIKGHTYKVGEVVRASSGPCLHCTCGGDGQMKCDPKACTPEPMLRQMIAAAVSAKRRR